MLFISAALYAGAQTINLEVKNEPLLKALKSVEKQSGYTLIYGKNQLDNTKPVTVSMRNASLQNALNILFRNQQISYYLRDPKFIVVVNKPGLYTSTGTTYTSPDRDVIRGTVTGEDGTPLPGVTIRTTGVSAT
ncbi:STN and carboxypeptidase regulatory-like domain-containing protein, partial [uncultured Chitinophaga sp.]|uniref:STN domain-containing protein n=1 Tax=uncultured Chitinophaga sp. TaxID=339340 RepID=UPI0025E38E74